MTQKTVALGQDVSHPFSLGFHYHLDRAGVRAPVRYSNRSTRLGFSQTGEGGGGNCPDASRTR
jgi:hypothetical protein